MENNNIVLALSGCFEEVKISLFQENSLLIEKKLASRDASRLLVSEISQCLSILKKTLDDVAFFVIDRGPGAFTSLRVVIVSANSLALFKNIPLVGYCSLEELALTQQNIDNALVVSILNAYGNQLFYSIFDTTSKSFLEKNICSDLEDFFEKIKILQKNGIYSKIVFVGDGVVYFKQQIALQRFNNLMLVEIKSVDLPLDNILKKAYSGDFAFEKEISPLYIKENFAAIKKPNL